MNALRAVLEWVREPPVLAILVALLIGLLVVFVIVGVFDPAWVYGFLFGEVKDADKSRILELIGVGMGGVLLAIGAAVANRRAVAMEVTNRGAEDERRQERLKNAIEHLGHESDSVRLGGAYELVHLARDTEDLRQTVLDILCAHIRRTTGEAGYREEHRSKPSEEVQSLLTLLFVQEHAVFRGCRIDLQGSWLNGAMLERARLQEANLSGAYLQEANLHEAQLQGANLRDAQLQGANLHVAQLQGAKLHGAQLKGAQLQGANLHEAQLQRADLREAQLQGANLHVAQLQGANLHEGQLQGANLHAARLQGADLHEAQLQGANLHVAELQGADLHEVQLQGANLHAVRLQGADLHEAQLQGADLHAVRLQGADLHEAQLQGANLHVARLQGADLHEAQLQGADLHVAELQGADLHAVRLQGADLHEAQLQGANLHVAELQGADLHEAQLQGANLHATHLQGATCQGSSHVSLEERIRERIGQESDLSGVTFAGGLSRENVDSIVKDLPDEEVKELREKLEPHVGKPASNELLEDSGAIVGAYTAEEAERWIAEYREATGEV